MRGDNGTPETPDWSIQRVIRVSREEFDRLMDDSEPPKVIPALRNLILEQRHRDNCTLIDCRICTPPHVTRGEN